MTSSEAKDFVAMYLSDAPDTLTSATLAIAAALAAYEKIEHTAETRVGCAMAATDYIARHGLL